MAQAVESRSQLGHYAKVGEFYRSVHAAAA